MDGYRFRCYPTDAQAQTLRQWIGCQRFIYNAKVGEDRYFRRFAKSALPLTGTPIPIDQCYAQFKTEQTPFLAEVPGVILRNRRGALEAGLWPLLCGARRPAHDQNAPWPSGGMDHP